MNETDIIGLLKQAEKECIAKFVVGVVIAKNNDVLIVKRRADDFRGGSYEIPGGGVEPNETIIGAINRETLEETGLKITDIINYLGYFDYLGENSETTRQLNFHVKVAGYNVRLSEEHTEYAWVSENSITKYFNKKDTIKAVIENFWKLSHDKGISVT